MGKESFQWVCFIFLMMSQSSFLHYSHTLHHTIPFLEKLNFIQKLCCMHPSCSNDLNQLRAFNRFQSVGFCLLLSHHYISNTLITIKKKKIDSKNYTKKSYLLNALATTALNSVCPKKIVPVCPQSQSKQVNSNPVSQNLNKETKHSAIA